MSNQDEWLQAAYGRMADAVRRADTVAAACQAAAGQLSAATGADYAGALLNNAVVASAGARSDQASVTDVLAATTAGPAADIGGIGTCDVAVASDPSGLRLVVLRRQGAINRRERALLAFTAPLLSLAVESLTTLAALTALHAEATDAQAEHQHLIGALLKRQQLLDNLDRAGLARSPHLPLEQVLHTTLAALQRRLGDDVVLLQLLDPDDSNHLVLVSEIGLTPAMFNAVRRSKTTQGASGRCLTENGLVVIDAPKADAGYAQLGVQAIAAAPVHADGRAVGVLLAASSSVVRKYTSAERETLLAFAEQTSQLLAEEYQPRQQDSLPASAQRGALQDASLPAIISAVVSGRTAPGRHLLVPPVPPQPLRIDVAKVSVALSNLVDSAITCSIDSSPLVVETDVAEGIVSVTVTVQGEFPAGTDPSSYLHPAELPVHYGAQHDLYVASRLAEDVAGTVSAGCQDGTMTFTLSFPAGATAPTATRAITAPR